MAMDFVCKIPKLAWQACFVGCQTHTELNRRGAKVRERRAGQKYKLVDDDDDDEKNPTNSWPNIYNL